MIINSDNKIGLIFSKELLEQEKTDTNSELINHIIDIHNNFADQVKEGKYTKKEFTSFRNKIAQEPIINSKIILKLCDLFLEDDKIIFKELVTLCNKNIIYISETNRINFMAAGIREINSKLKSFASAYFNSIITIPESRVETLKIYSEYVSKLEDTNSEEYHHFIDSYHDFVNRTFTNKKIKQILIESEDLEYINLLNCFKLQISKIKLYIEHHDSIHARENIDDIKRTQALRQLGKLKRPN